MKLLTTLFALLVAVRDAEGMCDAVDCGDLVDVDCGSNAEGEVLHATYVAANFEDGLCCPFWQCPGDCATARCGAPIAQDCGDDGAGNTIQARYVPADPDNGECCAQWLCEGDTCEGTVCDVMKMDCDGELQARYNRPDPAAGACCGWWSCEAAMDMGNMDKDKKGWGPSASFYKTDPWDRVYEWAHYYSETTGEAVDSRTPPGWTWNKFSKGNKDYGCEVYWSKVEGEEGLVMRPYAEIMTEWAADAVRSSWGDVSDYYVNQNICGAASGKCCIRGWKNAVAVCEMSPNCTVIDFMDEHPSDFMNSMTPPTSMGRHDDTHEHFLEFMGIGDAHGGTGLTDGSSMSFYQAITDPVYVLRYGGIETNKDTFQWDNTAKFWNSCGSPNKCADGSLKDCDGKCFGKKSWKEFDTSISTWENDFTYGKNDDMMWIKPVEGGAAQAADVWKDNCWMTHVGWPNDWLSVQDMAEEEVWWWMEGASDRRRLESLAEWDGVSWYPAEVHNSSTGSSGLEGSCSATCAAVGGTCEEGHWPTDEAAANALFDGLINPWTGEPCSAITKYGSAMKHTPILDGSGECVWNESTHTGDRCDLVADSDAWRRLCPCSGVIIPDHTIAYGFGYSAGSTITVHPGETLAWTGVDGHTITWMDANDEGKWGIDCVDGSCVSHSVTFTADDISDTPHKYYCTPHSGDGGTTGSMSDYSVVVVAKPLTPKEMMASKWQQGNRQVDGEFQVKVWCGMSMAGNCKVYGLDWGDYEEGDCRALIGDYVCDQGQRILSSGQLGPNLDCPKFADPNGDSTDGDAGDCNCEDGRTMTCSGYCLSDFDCASTVWQKEKCTDWLLDDVCDYGQRISDENITMHFECAMYEYDNGACSQEDMECPDGDLTDEQIDGSCPAEYCMASTGDDHSDCDFDNLADCEAGVDDGFGGTCAWGGDASGSTKTRDWIVAEKTPAPAPTKHPAWVDRAGVDMYKISGDVENIKSEIASLIETVGAGMTGGGGGAQWVEPTETQSRTPPTIHDKDRVWVSYFHSGYFYEGTISNINGKNGIEVAYNDGDEQTDVEKDEIMALEEMWEGDTVWMSASERGDWNMGKVSGMEDGEMGVNYEFTMADGETVWEYADWDAVRPEQEFHLGDHVWAEKDGNLRWFKGVITKAWRQGEGDWSYMAYDVTYTNGDVDKNILSPYIYLIHPNRILSMGGAGGGDMTEEGVCEIVAGCDSP